MAKKTLYKWINRLVEKITKTESPLNNEFDYYGRHIVQLSGTPDYTEVTIWDDNSRYGDLASFSFDFLTKNLHFEGYENDDIREAIVMAFVKLYDKICVSDELMKENRLGWEEYVNHPDIYVEEAVEEARKELDKLDKLSMGWVSVKDIKKM